MSKKSEQGQILIIFTIVLVVLLGFTSLAVDVGMTYGDRRYNQSISDTASLAGAGAAAQYLEKNGITYSNFACDNAKVVASFSVAFEAARTRASNNLVSNLDNNLSDKHGIEVTCVNDDTHFDKHIDVHTMVTSKVPTTFMQLFYGGEVKNTVNAVARIHPRTELVFGHAIVSLDDACHTKDGGIVFDGDSEVDIHGGGVFSNSCIEASGKINVDVKPTGAGIDYFGTITYNGHPVLSPDPEKAPAKMPIQEINPPSCSSDDPVASSGGGTINPGNYSKIKLTNGSLTLKPGLYCLTGDMDIQGGTVNGSGVTIYLKKDGTKDTNVQINGGAEVHLNAPTDGTAVNGAKVGILFFMATGNAGNMTLLGNSASSFAGAVYGRDANIDVGGTSGVNPTYNTQLVGKYVKVHGNSKIDINYQNMQPYTDQPKLDMME
jgi:hypothetical protein